MKNTMQDLNNHLFAQIERLNDESIKGEDIKIEIEKAKAMSHVARVISDNAKLELEAQKLAYNGEIQQTPKMLSS